MIKFLFLDFRQIETIQGFARKLERPAKHPASPLMESYHPWGAHTMAFYGSVVCRPDDGLFQMWYTTGSPKGGAALCYAESRDGIDWNRPPLDVVLWRGRGTNIVFDQEPHGACVIYDTQEQRSGWKYKMLTGASPSARICAYRSGDGIHWERAAENPVIGTNPDCPMSFCRMADGRFVVFHRAGWADRRIGRSESWNFRNFSEAVIVMQPDQNDPPNTQFYGLGAAPYGQYLIGTLWIYHTDPADMDFYKMKGYQEPELVHSRGGHAWHRTAQGEPWIQVEKDPSRFDSGQIQPASAPVYLEDEVRFYYVGTRTRHGEHTWKGKEKLRAGVGFASCKPDRFVGVTAKAEGRLLTRPFWTDAPRFCVNAAVRKGGVLRAEITDIAAKPIKGFTMADAVPFAGDSDQHVFSWKNNPDPSHLANRELRIRIQCRNATIYSIYSATEEQSRRYWDFRIASHVNMEVEKGRR